jgi:hypothetical protein
LDTEVRLHNLLKLYSNFVELGLDGVAMLRMARLGCKYCGVLVAPLDTAGAAILLLAAVMCPIVCFAVAALPLRPFVFE